MAPMTADPERAASALAALDRGPVNEYDGAQSSPRRREPRHVLRSEDDELNGKGRRKLIATTQDLRRNFAVARWAINKHLDYVSRFNFQSNSGDARLDDQIEALMRSFARKENCDVAGRHPLPRMIRLAEACAVVAGDMIFNLLSSGRLQAIEGERVRTPNTDLPRGFNPDEWTHGVRTTKAGKATGFAVCNRDRTGKRFTLAKILPARHVIHHAFYDRFDQVRGVSPIAAALNDFQDIREAHAYALARMKVSQLFGLVTYRDEPEPLGTPVGAGEFQDEPPFEIDFNKGPFQLDLAQGDKAEFLQDNSPSTQFDTFTSKIIGIALKTLDLPLSFYDEAHTNFFGSRAALMQYLSSCEWKRDNLRGTLDAITAWRLRLWIESGELVLPRGMSAEDLRWEWMHAGTPWWDPIKDIRGDVMAIHAGFETRDDVTRRRTGRRFRDILGRLAEEESLIRESGATIVAPGPTVFNPEAVVATGRGEDDAAA